MLSFKYHVWIECVVVYTGVWDVAECTGGQPVIPQRSSEEPAKSCEIYVPSILSEASEEPANAVSYTYPPSCLRLVKSLLML